MPDDRGAVGAKAEPRPVNSCTGWRAHRGVSDSRRHSNLNFVRETRRRAILTLAAVSGAILLISCTPSVPYEGTFTGSTQSPRIQVNGGEYNMEARQITVECATQIIFQDSNARTIVYLGTKTLGFPPNKPVVGPTNWYGYSGPLATGTYRFIGTGTSGCTWSVRLTVFSGRTSQASGSR